MSADQFLSFLLLMIFTSIKFIVCLLAEDYIFNDNISTSVYTVGSDLHTEEVTICKW